MSDEIQVWSDVQVNVESARGTAVAIQSISLASPGVVGATAHGFADGDVLALTLVGMRELNKAVVVVSASASGTFEMLGLDGGLVDTTDFQAFVSGSAEKITFGSVADAFTDVSPSGGEAADIPVNNIHNSQDKSIPGNYTPLVYALGAQWKPSDPALVEMRVASRSKADRAVEYVFSDGTTAVRFIAKPSTSLAPGGSAGGVVTTSAKLNVQGPLSFFSAA